jgi:ankyrin repeat protein
MDNERNELQYLTIGDSISIARSTATVDYKKRIKEYRVDFDLRTHDTGETVLIALAKEQAVLNDNAWVILEYFADPNIKDFTNNTALHHACKNNFKGYILALLLFGADTEVINEEEKKPFDYTTYRDEEIEAIKEVIKKYRFPFLQLTRKRRNKLKKIFDFIDVDNSRTIGDYKLKCFNEWLNNDGNEGLAQQDAKIFIDEVRLFKGEEVFYCLFRLLLKNLLLALRGFRLIMVYKQ